MRFRVAAATHLQLFLWPMNVIHVALAGPFPEATRLVRGQIKQAFVNLVCTQNPGPLFGFPGKPFPFNLIPPFTYSLHLSLFSQGNPTRQRHQIDHMIRSHRPI